MFIGHFAVGFAAKRVAPKTSLGPLIAAPIFLDVLWPFFVLAGLEEVKIDPGLPGSSSASRAMASCGTPAASSSVAMLVPGGATPACPPEPAAKFPSVMVSPVRS